MKIDKKIIKELTDYLNEFNLTEIEYTEKDTKIKVSKSSSSVSSQITSVANPSPVTKEKISAPVSGTEIKSPIIGTAYLAPEPGAKKFSEVGKKIKKGETIMIVEAMKTMNHVPSTVDGIIKEICVEDGQPVEYGQTIIIVE
ncbi:MAG: acetyl-CoA carboxylase biotin carboxyl carrier protein subunit [Candidatus Pelagibacter sp.]|jgi:acetyl-CoA carboxylase biotin carboxyl carrier protein|nr:acetyl-CoA carboxylase biotin carboxyl carrier protein subunit [Candidatus Pelagibacter sp.]MBT3693498.1 acetyl-CoA carboxylase biotin carboxyl carrier protein subunit [Candidatus Pelagibacter sp.]MDB2527773.1 acetyl-CoA carboxylase biotin carboxyl carrier protein subunit [Candidatus Pelagibacter bacterium]MDC0448823.1 acetyl-CoA carboxylase biotin carboxyl carrier protein subunit [Candidatus Pelagibacter sp.]MDC1082441.1 acetyl-CoA carboxylase biotin carboxyl carrier protein subunit [Candid|tara:strand:+ start:152 stop:577 length:426 start_codon:yes stop_codon:yes gene_type:complete